MNAMFELLGEMLASVVGLAVRLVRDHVVEPFMSDEAYRRGFLIGVAAAGVVGLLGRKLAYWWDKIRDFLKPSKEPATKEGPSSAAKAVSTSTGCAAAFGQLAIVVLAIIGLGAIVYLAISTAGR